jgi:hypothetical protein
MRKLSPGPELDIAAAYRADGTLNDLLVADRWLDTLEPFVIEWEHIWPM